MNKTHTEQLAAIAIAAATSLHTALENQLTGTASLVERQAVMSLLAMCHRFGCQFAEWCYVFLHASINSWDAVLLTRERFGDACTNLESVQDLLVWALDEDEQKNFNHRFMLNVATSLGMPLNYKDGHNMPLRIEFPSLTIKGLEPAFSKFVLRTVEVVDGNCESAEYGVYIDSDKVLLALYGVRRDDELQEHIADFSLYEHSLDLCRSLNPLVEFPKPTDMPAISKEPIQLEQQWVAPSRLNRAKKKRTSSCSTN
jgi:hypothetical protein